MHITTVVPIARGIPFDTLTYYSAEQLLYGTLVQIPFRRQVITGIVVETMTLLEAKTMIKHAAFSLKKIKTVLTHIPFFEYCVHAARETGKLTLSPVGAVLGSVIPSFLFEYINTEKITNPITEVLSKTTHFTEEVTLGTTIDRIDAYKRMIRTAFAEKKSLIFIAPTIRGVEYWKETLEKGIVKHVVVMHSKVTKKNIRSHFSLIKTSDRPLLIFATPGFIGIPRSDIGVFIVEDESSNLYKTSDRYSIDQRIFIRSFCEAGGFTLVWGDTIPRFETIERLGKSHLPRAFVPDKLHIVPIEHYRTTLPREVMDLVLHAQKKKRRLFIYTNRKGVAPMSRCSDCGTIMNCVDCSLPMVLRNKILGSGEQERYFICTHCGGTLPPTHRCTYCDSWNISPLPVGTESIRDAVIALVGEEAVITIDDNLTPDTTTITTLIETVQKHKFTIVIGTIKVLPYLKGIHYALFPFFDRLLSIPSLYTTEQALRLVMECNERVSDGVIICTKNPDFPFLRQLETQKINAIIYDEMNIRKEIGYPPYGALIKVSITVPEGYRQSIVAKVTVFFEGIEATPLPARRVTHGSMKVLLSWIIKEDVSYIEEEGQILVTFFDTLRFPYKIEQNPERL